MRFLPKLFRKSLALLSLTALTLSFTGNVTFAAFGDYAVTGGNLAGGLPVVGAASQTLNTITLDSTGSADAFDDIEHIRVSLNTIDFPGVVFDTSVGIAPVDGDCAVSPGAPVTYSGGGTVATIQLFLGAGPDCDDGDTITVDDLAVTTLFANASVDSAAMVNVAIANDTVVFTADEPTATTTLETVTAGTLTATNVQPNTLQDSELVTVTVSFTTPGSVAIPTDGKIVVTFGAGFDVSAAANGTCSTMDGTFATTDALQVVTITRQDDGAIQPAAAETCTLTGIRNPTTTGTTGVYAISVTDTDDNVIYTDAAVAADTITAGGSGGGMLLINNSTEASGGTTGTQETTEGDTQETTQNGTQESVEGGTQESMEGGSQQSMQDEEEMSEEAMMKEAHDITDEDSASANNETPFGDVDGHWATGYINFLYDMGVVSGRTEASFAPNAEMTRAEIVKIALLTFGHDVDEDAVPSFTDVSAGDWFAPYLAAAEEKGIVEGYEDGSFHPNGSVNRAEALKILLTAGGFTIGETVAAPFTDVPDGAWFAPYVDFAYANGVVSGKTSTTFAPGDNITRAEMSKIAVKAYGLSSQ